MREASLAHTEKMEGTQEREEGNNKLWERGGE